MFLLFRELVAAKQRREDESDERMVLAWTIAALIRQKKLPDVKKLLTKRNTGPQTVGQLRGMLQQISERYGLKMRKATKSLKAKHG